MRRYRIRAALLASVVVLAGCATTGPYLYNDTDLVVRTADTDLRAFNYIRAYSDDGETIFYGTVDHHHEYGAEEGHVDLVIIDQSGRTERVESLPLRWTSAKQRGHGWDGAEFRTRFKSGSTSGLQIYLAFHEGGGANSSYDCGQNRALLSITASGEEDRELGEELHDAGKPAVQ